MRKREKQNINKAERKEEKKQSQHTKKKNKIKTL